MSDTLTVGQTAPDFTLPNVELKSQNLNDFSSNNVVLAFYPGAFTGVCTKEMCTLRDSMAKLNELKAQVVGISVDSPFANKAFAETNQLGFPLLSDTNRDVIKRYGIELSNFAGIEGYTVAQRSIFILDQNKVIRYAWVADNPGIEPNYEEIEQILADLI